MSAVISGVVFVGGSVVNSVLTTGLFCLTYAVLSAYEWLVTPSEEEHDL
ncbi:hypothetical protein FDI34_gp09 [Acinetobacter phage vB_ApiP_P2]|uniref:Uncharacterized protein n=1 Tax=Acinetobacter phage vB_ApiP_P2 TaxID=2016053 RepID=A0A221SC21_9CAUD|nr:hypothetical protein FDI34_gp09 [Acinetobacter phage vB_ApiP_P2]ASN73519.1 hypothetical protein P2_09 [Acinetobacter phage vB_ApiP_P2]